MKSSIDRRQFLRLAGYGGVVFASALPGAERALAAREDGDDFYFVQLSDTHWGFEGPAINPDAKGTLRKAVAEVNALTEQPDFIIFTGDLTHTTDDPTERRRRLREFREIVSGLRVKQVHFMPGEHDAALDRGEAYREQFGATHTSFDVRDIHFITLDNVSDPQAVLGDEQLRWLAADLAKLKREQRIVVFTHRPLFDLAPTWDWATGDGAKAIELLTPFPWVTVFYGHIHQEHHHMTGRIAHHAAKGLMFPLPAPLSVARKSPIPWDPAHPYAGLGFREVNAGGIDLRVEELGIEPKLSALAVSRANWFVSAALIAACAALSYGAASLADTPPAPAARLIKVSTHRFEFVPNQLTLKKGETVEIELDTQDVPMGFSAPDFATRATIVPGQVTRVRFTPQKVGIFTFLCDVFCGSGHEDMNGTITVTE